MKEQGHKHKGFNRFVHYSGGHELLTSAYWTGRRINFYVNPL